MKGMILAAGEGTRLRPQTLACPKVMLPVAGRPLLEHTICWLRHYGIDDIAMNLHHRSDVVVDHFGDGSAFGVTITYSRETSLLGTAGAIKRLAAHLDETFVLHYGDVLTDLDLKRFVDVHLSRPRRPCLSMALYRVDRPTECGIVSLDGEGRIRRFQEKPPPSEIFSDLANVGVVVLDPELLAHIPPEQCWDLGHDLMPRLLRLDIPMYGVPVLDDTYVLDVGTPERYARALREWPTWAARQFVADGS